MEGNRTALRTARDAGMVTLTAVPSPVELLGPEGGHDASWFMVGEIPGTCNQGWKIYISALETNYVTVLSAVTSVLYAHGVPFKYLRSIRDLRRVNAGQRGFSQIGKCIVGYVHDDRVIPALLTDLYREMRSLAHDAPFIPRLPRVWSGYNLFYRYGSYVNKTIIIDGVEIEDDRAHPADILARISKNPFTALGFRGAPEGPIDRSVEENNSMLRRYPVFKTICRSGKGGVFIAVDLTNPTYTEVLVKIGLKNGRLAPDGRDGADFIRHEREMYKSLSGTTLRSVVPLVIAYAEEPGANVLVLSLLHGENLAEWRTRGGADVDVLRESLAIIQRIHDAGFFLGDAKLSNFVKTDVGIAVVDLESMGPLSEADTNRSPCTFAIYGLGALSRQVFDVLHFLISAIYREHRLDDSASRVVDIHKFISQIDVRDQWDEAVTEKLKHLIGLASLGVQ